MAARIARTVWVTLLLEASAEGLLGGICEMTLGCNHSVQQADDRVDEREGREEEQDERLR